MPAPNRRQRNQVLRLLEEFEPRLAAAFIASVDELRGAVNMAELEAALRAGNIEAAMRALRIDRAAFIALETQIAASYTASGTAMAASVSALTNPGTGSRLFIRFDVRNPAAERWVAEHSSNLIVEIIADQRAAARVAIEAGMARGDNPRRTALDIVGRINRATGRREGGIVGLTSGQSQWVENARAELASGDPAMLRKYLDRKARDKRFDRSVLKAIREGAPLPADTVARATARYSDSLLRLRGETIGRTEALSSIHASRAETMRQAAESGQINPARTMKVWSSTGDSRTRDSHMDMDGEEVRFDEPFQTPSGALLMFPTDSSMGAPAEETIQCRCSVSYRVDYFAGVA